MTRPVSECNTSKKCLKHFFDTLSRADRRGLFPSREESMFDRICTELSLGTLLAPPVPLTGGYTHRMLRLDTTTGRYVVKLLNPEIMARPSALESYRAAEAFEALLEAAGLPILPALTIGGHKMQCVAGQYLYVFDFYHGRVLRDEEITPAHCLLMGEVLARIHAVDRRTSPAAEANPPIDWAALADALLASASARTEGSLLQRALPMLEQVTRAAEDAACHLPPLQALCHNDMDAKNVLWRDDAFRIIDLECLGYANPLQEMLDLAISWAGWPAEEARFKAFVTGYYAAGGERVTDAASLYDSRRNHLDWLAYNARRALFDDLQERRIGREQVIETIGKIENDQHNRQTILRWMEAVHHG